MLQAQLEDLSHGAGNNSKTFQHFKVKFQQYMGAVAHQQHSKRRPYRFESRHPDK